MHRFAAIVWDPSPAVFNWNLPFLGRPILWYGFLFALGLLLGYRSFLFFLRREPATKARALEIAEATVLPAVMGILLGARLGEIFFYQKFQHFVAHPGSIMAVWEGGLASHGGVAGLLIGLAYVTRKKGLSYLNLIDLLAFPSAATATCIRLGNLMNQEILGTATSLPWGFLFLHPAGGGAVVARHPVQLYEALFYALLFVVGYTASKRNWRFFSLPGRRAGFLLCTLFSFRYLVELVKEEQSLLVEAGQLPGGLDMAQYLSLPLILFGALLMWLGHRWISAPEQS